MNKLIKNIVLMPIVALGLTSLSSCSDWLDLKPQTSIIAEDMWKDQSDVEAVVASMYRGMIQNDFMERVMAWGELRSDNLLQNDSKKSTQTYTSTYELYKSVSMSSILETNSLSSWGSVYEVIDLANYIIHYAPGVCAEDADYTTSEMLANVAEARTVRALCYFYLIRTFKEVPYITEPTLDDEQDLQIAATPASEIVSKIIADLEIAHANARTSFSSTSSSTTLIPRSKFRITRNAVSAILADVLLWKASDPDVHSVTADTIAYNRVIELCDEVFAGADTTKTSSSFLGNNSLSMCEDFLTVFGSSSATSTEAIFALYTDNSTTREQDARDEKSKNDTYLTINKWYGTGSTGLAYVTTSMYVGQQDKYTLNAGYADKQTVFNVAKTSDVINNDQRYTYSTSSRISTGADVYYVYKYMASIGTNANQDGTTSKNYPSWIFYRLADIYLMRAEARIEKENEAHQEKDTEGKIIYASQADSISYAVNMGRALSDIGTIYNRSNQTKLVTTTISNENLSELCLAERRREFLFEGKRWFDLLRAARRKYKFGASGYASYVSNFVANKLSDGLVASRLNSMDALYWPFYRDELKRNSKLVQNPYYKSESDNIEKK